MVNDTIFTCNYINSDLGFEKYFENEGAEEQRDILKQGIKVTAAQKKISCRSLSAFFDEKEWFLKAPDL